MTDLDYIMRAVLEFPDDDLPRLVFADRLDERGKLHDRARAELIRLQCESFGPACPPRVEKILRTWGLKWVPKLGRLQTRVGSHRAAMNTLTVRSFGESHHVFRRGFVGQVEHVLPTPVLFTPVAAGGYCQQALAASPVERVVFAITYHSPELIATFGPAAAGRWVCKIEDTEAEEGPWEYVTTDRKTLVAGLPKFFAESLADVTFERVRGDEDYP